MYTVKTSLIWKIIYREKKSSLLIFFVSVISTLSNSLGLTLLVPILFKIFKKSETLGSSSSIERLINKYVGWLPGDSVNGLLGLIVCLFVLKNLLIAYRVHLVTLVSNKHLLYFRTELLKHYLKKDLHFFYKEGSGKLLNQMVMNVEKSSKAVIDTVEIMGMFTQLLAYGCVLVYLSWQLTSICVVLFIPLVLLFKAMGRTTKILSGERAAKFGALSQAIGDTFKGIRFVKMANRESDHVSWIGAQSESLQVRLKKMTFISGIGQPITELSALVILMGFIAMQFYSNRSQVLSIDSFFSFLLILSRALPLFNIVVNRALEIASNLGTLNEVERALSDRQWIGQNKGTKPIPKSRCNLIFEGVSFSYPESDRSVLNEISLQIEEGEAVAIIGPSGSGKSTITDLILQFYQPTKGRILMNGVNISEYDIRDYRKRVGLVPQDSVMFFSTIRENLCYFRPDASQSEISQVIEQADLTELISTLPRGLETNIGEGGINLSGGQRQRLSIARTLLLNPELLIFDEATSSLDSLSEAKIVSSIRLLSQGRTSITIAHRLGTILHCDKVFFIEHGWNIECGKISALLKTNSRFKKYAESQNLKLDP